MLTQKAFSIVGGTALRGAEMVALRRKIAGYKPFFPHKDFEEPPGVNVDDMYDEILEMARYVFAPECLSII